MFLEPEETTTQYGLVFSIYHHDFFKYLIGAYLLPFLPNGEYSLSNARSLTEENIENYKEHFTEDEKKLILLCSQIHPKNLIRQYKGDPFHAQSFFRDNLQPKNAAVYERILNSIEKKLIKIFPLLQGKAVFEMGYDGYPAQKRVKTSTEKASVTFHFQKDYLRLLYYITVRLQGENTILTNQQVHILTNHPAWILRKGVLFTFKDPIDGKKMMPFLSKMNIEVGRDKMEEYFRKFVTRVFERYEVRYKGFMVKVIEKEPVFHFYIRKNHQDFFSFEQAVGYGDYELRFMNAEEEKLKTQVFFEIINQDYCICKVERKLDKEESVRAMLMECVPNKESFLAWENIPKNKALTWMSENMNAIREAGMQIHKEEGVAAYSFDKPMVEVSSLLRGDWFDIQAVVEVGGFRIPFVRFRNHILKNQREFLLPDGKTIILPETWFSQYHYLTKLGTAKEDSFAVTTRDYGLVKAQLEEANSKDKTVTLRLADPLIVKQELPISLKAQLRSYQEDGYYWLMQMQSCNRGVILADDMGLGKTLQTLAVFQKEKEKGNKSPSLVIMPTSLVFNWKKEAAKFAPELSVMIHTGSNRTKSTQVFGFFDVILTTYSIIRLDIEWIRGYSFHYVVLDESQSIKNPESKVSKAVKQLTATHRISLTGTPIENSVLDIWSQMQFLNPEIFTKLYGSEQQFQKEYVIPIEKYQNKEKLKALKKTLRLFIMRRKKEEVADDLPPKIENIHFCEMTETQEKAYQAVRDAYRNYLLEMINDGSLQKKKLNILAGLQKIRQLAIHPRLIQPEMEITESGKYEEIKRLLYEIIAEDSKVLIFSQFVGMLQMMKQDFIKEGIQFQYIDGSISAKDREKAVTQFQENHLDKVFLISLKAGGTGLNLTAADYVFIVDPWWNPAVEMQAIDRAHRIGQKKTVFYYKFITRNSIEEKILRLQQTKFQLSEDMLSEEEGFVSVLDEEELKWILS